MIKLIPPHAWGPGDGLQVALVKAGMYGFGGHDFGAFVKRAAHPLAEWVRHNRPGAGEELVHVVALSSTEKVGCFFAGAPVQTETGHKPIEQIRVGDSVLTHKGRYRRVTDVFTVPYTGRRLQFRGSGLPPTAPVTPEHPCLVVRRDDYGVRQRAPSFLRRKGKTAAQGLAEAVAKARFVPAGDLVVGDYLMIPTDRHVPNCERLADDLAYFYGVYLAEGCIKREYRDVPTRGKIRAVVLTMGTGDSAVLDRLRSDTGKTLTARPSLTSKKGIRVDVAGNELAATCHAMFGNAATIKRIPAVIFGQSADWKLRFIAGYLDGDGCVTRTGPLRCRGTVRASTASLNLALDLQALLASVGIPAAVQAGKNKSSNGCFGSGDFDIYAVSVGSAYASRLLAHCERLRMPVIPRRQLQARSFTGCGYLLVPITEIVEDSVVDAAKFNFEVEEDNSYVVYVSVHNCNRNGDGYSRVMLERDYPTFEKHAFWYLNHKNSDPARSYGRVKKAYWNPDLERVELICALYGTKQAAARNGGLVAEYSLSKLANNEDLAVSQSCKVPTDVCVSCGNRAKTRAQYCGPERCKYGGCRDNLGRVFDDGFHLYVDNPRCDFFDISDVSQTRGADRTAFATGKVAAADRVVGGAELAELMGLVAPEYLLTPRAYAALRCARKLAAAGAPAAPALGWADTVALRAAAAGKEAGDIGVSLPDDAARHGRLAELAAAGVVLPPPAWLALVTGVPAEKCARAFGRKAPDPHTDLAARPDLHDVLEDGALADIRLSPEKWAHLAPTPRAVEREAARAALRAGGGEKAAAHQTAPEGVRAEAAARYLAYQANLLAAHENSANFDLLFSECVRQSRNLSA